MKGFLRVLLEYVRIFFVVYWVFELKLISMDFRILTHHWVQPGVSYLILGGCSKEARR